MVAGRDFYHDPSDGLWCQSAIDGGDEIGRWLYPNGEVVPDSSGPGPVSVVHDPGQIGLLRSNTLIDYEGFYTCMLPDENNVSQVLMIWAAGNAAYDGIYGKRECIWNQVLN